MGTCIFVIHGPTVNIETGRYNIHDLTSISFRHHDLKNCAVSVCGLFKWVTTSEEQSEAALLILGSSARPGNCPLQDHPDQFWSSNTQDCQSTSQQPLLWPHC